MAFCTRYVRPNFHNISDAYEDGYLSQQESLAKPGKYATAVCV